jgi:hypothetical protein
MVKEVAMALFEVSFELSKSNEEFLKKEIFGIVLPMVGKGQYSFEEIDVKVSEIMGCVKKSIHDQVLSSFFIWSAPEVMEEVPVIG